MGDTASLPRAGTRPFALSFQLGAGVAALWWLLIGEAMRNDMPRVISGWKLSRDDRRKLLEHFPPCYERVVGDHVTYRYGAGNDEPLRHETSGEIVGEANDGRGVQALVVSIGGTTDREDESRYHITWSLGKDRRAAESNDVIKAIGWIPISPAIPVKLQPDKWQD